MAPEHVHTRDLGEAIQTVGQVYCAHRLSLDPRARGIDTTLDIRGSARQPVVGLRYGAPVKVDAGHFPDLFLIMRCIEGQGRVIQGNRQAAWRPGLTIPVSANLGTSFDFGTDFSQVTIKPDKEKLEGLCSAWLGHPLEDGLRFELQPFSASLEQAWGSTLDLLIGTQAAPLPPLAEAALEDFMLTLLLQGQPHNHSAELARPVERLPSRLVRRAEAFIVEHAHESLSVADVARAVGTSVRALQASFHGSSLGSPSALLRQVRLENARRALSAGDAFTTVTDVALRCGFLHLGRFSVQYRACFGESPSQTLMRGRQRRPGR